MKLLFISFQVFTRPVGKGRPRFGNGRTYTDDKTEAFERHIALIARREMGRRRALDVPVMVSVVAGFKRGSSSGEHPTHNRSADADNILKAVLDAMNGIVYTDDKLVVDARCRKEFDALDRDVVEVSVFTLEEEEPDDHPMDNQGSTGAGAPNHRRRGSVPVTHTADRHRGASKGAANRAKNRKRAVIDDAVDAADGAPQ